MMQEKIGRELERYGRAVTVYTAQHPNGVAVKACVQPMREKGTAKAAPPLSKYIPGTADNRSEPYLTHDTFPPQPETR